MPFGFLSPFKKFNGKSILSEDNGKNIVLTRTKPVQFTYTTATTITCSQGHFSDDLGNIYYTTTTETLDLANVGVVNGVESALIPNTWYYIFGIVRLSDGDTGFFASTSFASPTPPAGYTVKKYLGVWLTDGSSNLIQYTTIQKQNGLLYILPTEYLIENHTNDGGSGFLPVPAIPPVKCEARFRLVAICLAGNAFPYIYYGYNANNMPIKTGQDTGGNSQTNGTLTLSNSTIYRLWGGNAARTVEAYLTEFTILY